MSENFDIFYALDPSKQSRIINAALTEFADKGFTRASTNTIAKNAKIGKGMLFYYFGSKETLFDFLCRYTLDFATSSYLANFSPATNDFIKRYQAFTNAKQKVVSDSPLPFAFLELFYRGDDLPPCIAKYNEEITALQNQIKELIYENIDYSLFRSDIDPESTVTYIKWLVDSYQNKLVEKFKHGEIDVNNENLIREEVQRFELLCKDLRKLFYKEEE